MTLPAAATAPLADTRRDTRLVQRFALWGAAAIAVFAVVMAVLLGRFMEQQMLARDAAVSRDFVQSVARTQRLDSAIDVGGHPAAITEFVKHLSDLPEVLRVNLYSTERRVIWSSDEALIGQTFAENDELDEALAGAVVVHSAHGPGQPDKTEHVRLDAQDPEYVENYVPVLSADGQKVVAVVELYRRRAALLAAIHQGQRLVWLSATGGGLFLFLCLLGFVWRTQAQLREQQRRLVEADALALVGEIAAAVAHSIRNPLGSIRSSAELQRELAGDPDGHHDDVMRHVDRIEQLVRNMLSYAAPASDTPAQCDLDPLIQQAAERSRADLARQQKAFVLVHEAPTGHVGADALLLTQVLQSLLSNAAEATQAGHCVTLRACRDGTHAVIEVQDDGVGMPASERTEAFRPFYTTKPRGLGMGLALAQRVALRLGGDIHLDSSPGTGTCVRLRLPLITPSPP
jgi:two-component system sensor histidine kinase HydH